MTPAGYPKRIAAAILDLIVVTIGTTVVAWPFLIWLDFENRTRQVLAIAEDMARDPEAVQLEPALLQSLFTFMMGLLVLTLVLLLATHIYYIYLESSSSGQTLGKKALGIRVVDLQGNRITRTQAVYREALRWYVDGLFVLPAFIAMAMTPRRQRVGDIAAQTMVVDVSHSRT